MGEEAREVERDVLNVVDYAVVIDHTTVLTLPGSAGLHSALRLYDEIRRTARDSGTANLIARPDRSGQRPGLLLAQHSWDRADA